MSLADYVANGGKLERRLKFKYDRGYSFLPLRSRSGLGYEWAVLVDGRYAVSFCGPVSAPRGRFTELMSNKNKIITTYYPRYGSRNR